jgi:hypothetical protein
MRFIPLTFVLGLTIVSSQGAEIELVRLKDTLDQQQLSFPRSMSGSLTETVIAQVPINNGPTVTGDVQAAIDTDRASGTVLPAKGKYQFLLSMKTISRFHKIVMTGELKGATVSVDLSDLPRISGEPGWKNVISDKPLKSPSTAFSFQSFPAFRALVTITSTSNTPLELNDISFYGLQDIREVRLERDFYSNAQTTKTVGKSVKAKSEKEKAKETKSEDVAKAEPGKSSGAQNQFDIANIYAGAFVSHISSVPNPTDANYANDDDAESYVELSAGQKEAVTIINLGETRSIQNLSMVHSSGDADMIIYVVNELPWQEPNEDTVAQLAWLDPGLSFMGGISDAPFLMARASPRRETKTIRIDSTLLDKLSPFSTSKISDRKFSQVKSSPTKGRYVIIRFLGPNGKALGTNLKIYQISAFGDYPKGHFALARQPLPDMFVDALVSPSTAPETSSSTSEGTIDSGKLRAFFPEENEESSPTSP